MIKIKKCSTSKPELTKLPCPPTFTRPQENLASAGTLATIPTNPATDMSNMERAFIGTAVLCVVIAFVGHRMEIVDGLAKAIFGVSMIAFFIVRFFGERNA